MIYNHTPFIPGTPRDHIGRYKRRIPDYARDLVNVFGDRSNPYKRCHFGDDQSVYIKR